MRLHKWMKNREVAWLLANAGETFKSRLLAELDGDPFRDDYPLDMLLEDIEQEADATRRTALTAQALKRCRAARHPGPVDNSAPLHPDEVALVLGGRDLECLDCKQTRWLATSAGLKIELAEHGLVRVSKP